MRTPDRMISNYDIKVNPEIIKEHFANQKQVMKTYYSDACNWFYDKLIRTKQILDANGVLIGGYSMYYHFTRQVGKKIKTVGLAGSSLYNEIAGIKSLWERRGLDPDILEAILRDVFGIVLT